MEKINAMEQEYIEEQEKQKQTPVLDPMEIQ